MSPYVQVCDFTACHELYKINGEQTQIHSNFCLMVLTQDDYDRLEFMSGQVQKDWNYVFAEESEDGPNGDSFKVEVRKIYMSDFRRILRYKVFYSDPEALFDEDKVVHILTVLEDATRWGKRKMEIKIHLGEPRTWYYKDNEGFKDLESKRHEVSRTFLDMYRKWDLPRWGAKLMAFGALRDRLEAIGLSHTKAGQHSRLHELPKNVLALIMRLM